MRLLPRQCRWSSVFVIWIIFRLIFAVLMPQGIIPEGRIVSAITSLF